MFTDKDGHTILDFSAPVGGPEASLRSEAAGIFSILQKVEALYNGHVQLMIFNDCLVLLLILAWPGDVVHFDVIFPLIQKLRGWSKKVILIKVKSHAGFFLNEMADERAEKGRLSDAAPIFPGANKYGSLQLRITASFRAQVAEDKLPLPRDKAPNKQILRQAISMNLLRALKLRNTVFTREVLVQQHGAVVRNVIASCGDSLVAYWMKAMTQTLPVATYLHTINPINTPLSVLNVIKVAAKKKVFHIFSVLVLNFITLGQQLTIKSASFWQLHCRRM